MACERGKRPALDCVEGITSMASRAAHLDAVGASRTSLLAPLLPPRLLRLRAEERLARGRGPQYVIDGRERLHQLGEPAREVGPSIAELARVRLRVGMLAHERYQSVE